MHSLPAGLELISCPAVTPRGPTLLFLHGAAGAAWMWAEHLMPALAAEGWSCLALSFRGHGRSPGADRLQELGLDDYADDVRSVLSAIDGPVILVGHSLGGLVAQRLLLHPSVRGLVLLASVPPEGLAMFNFRLALSQPLLWSEVARLPFMTIPNQASVAMLTNALFSRGFDPGVAERHVLRLGAESFRALNEAQWPNLIASARGLGVPVLSIGAVQDALVPYDAVTRGAVYHGARLRMLGGKGHAIMLDTLWPSLVAMLLAWLTERYR